MLNAQYNLVLNPSFEDHDTCPDWGNTGLIRFAKYWSNPLYPTSPDYFNACDTGINHPFSVPSNYVGNQMAHTGIAYAGIATYYYALNPVGNNYREYIQNLLSDSLIAGVEYCIKLYVSLADSSRFYCNNLGVYFSPTIVHDTCPWQVDCPLNYLPQFENTAPLTNDSTWTAVSGSFIASGGEKYVLIGNFHDTSGTAATSTGIPISNYHRAAYYYIDDVLVTPCDSLTTDSQIEDNTQLLLYPNPSSGIYFIKLKNPLLIKNIEVYDSRGRLIYSNQRIDLPNYNLNLSSFSGGIYLIRIFTYKKIYQYKISKF